PLAVALKAGKRRKIGARGGMSDQGRRNARRVAGTEPQHEQRGERKKGDERDEHDHPAPPHARILVNHVLFRQLRFDQAHNLPSSGRSGGREPPCAWRVPSRRLKGGGSTAIHATSPATIAIAAA